jgi:hypothetical protein
MNHCNDFVPCGPSIGQYNSYFKHVDSTVLTMELYKNKFKNFIRTSKFKFSFQGLILCLNMVKYLLIKVNFLMLLFMNHCNDFVPCGPSIGQYNSYSYMKALINKYFTMFKHRISP